MTRLNVDLDKAYMAELQQEIAYLKGKVAAVSGAKINQLPPIRDLVGTHTAIARDYERALTLVDEQLKALKGLRSRLKYYADKHNGIVRRAKLEGA